MISYGAADTFAQGLEGGMITALAPDFPHRWTLSSAVILLVVARRTNL